MEVNLEDFMNAYREITPKCHWVLVLLRGLSPEDIAEAPSLQPRDREQKCPLQCSRDKCPTNAGGPRRMRGASFGCESEELRTGPFCPGLRSRSPGQTGLAA